MCCQNSAGARSKRRHCSVCCSSARCTGGSTVLYRHSQGFRAYLETGALLWVNLHPFNGPLSGTTRVSWYQKGKTNLDFTEARDSEWQWHQLGHMHVCTSLQTDNHASTPPLKFLKAGCPSCRPTNSVKAVKALLQTPLLLWVNFVT